MLMIYCWLCTALASSVTGAPRMHRSYLGWASRLEAAADEGHPEPAYHFYSELHSELAQTVEDWSGRVRPEQIGRTVEGRPIWAFHIRDPGTPVERSVLVTAQIHALEWVGAEVAMRLIMEQAERPEPGVALTVIPVLNVDGRMRVESDLRQGRNLYRRANAQKVDLNRDFAELREPRAVWRHVLPGYYATSPAPLSQPESRALAELADREVYDRAMSLHAAGGFIYTPWAGSWERPADHEEMTELARQMRGAQGRRPYRVVQLSRFLFFFRGHGMELDHLYARHGTQAFLMELTRGGFIWTDRSSFKTYFRWYNPVDPDHHIDQGIRALRVLIRTDPVQK
jgi:hypothetical protein